MSLSRQQIEAHVRARKDSQFAAKDEPVRALILDALMILDALGVPVEDATPRTAVMMAQSFLAVAGLRPGDTWSGVQSIEDGRALRTRDVIAWVNTHFGESVSRGSYDDIRRKYLIHPVEADIVARSSPDSARNNPERGYCLSVEMAVLVASFSTVEWDGQVRAFLGGRRSLRERLRQERELSRMPVALPDGTQLEFGPGEHNQLQKAIIESFLPIYGHGATLLYVGDAEDKALYYREAEFRDLGIEELKHGELPDVVAYSEEKGWLYLIEAVHSANPISVLRKEKLESLAEESDAGLILVTAFLDRAAFRKFVGDIAWETEVWIASEPDHLIHFDGQRFLGPYAS